MESSCHFDYILSDIRQEMDLQTGGWVRVTTVSIGECCTGHRTGGRFSGLKGGSSEYGNETSVNSVIV